MAVVVVAPRRATLPVARTLGVHAKEVPTVSAMLRSGG